MGSSIRADLPDPGVQAGATLALLASPDFGQAQADAARPTSTWRGRRFRQRELFTAGIGAQELEQAEADAARAARRSAAAL